MDLRSGRPKKGHNSPQEKNIQVVVRCRLVHTKIWTNQNYVPETCVYYLEVHP